MNSVKPREKRQKRENHFTDIGVRGRKTGVLIRKNILQDEDGLDNIDDFFESSEEEAEERVIPRVHAQSRTTHEEQADLDSTFGDSGDMELSAESGVAYSEQSSVSFVKQHPHESPSPRPANRSANSVKRPHHIFEDSMESPDITANKKSASLYRSVVTSTPNSYHDKPLSQVFASHDFDTPSRLSQSMESSVLSGPDESLSVLKQSPRFDEDLDLDDDFDNSNLATSSHQVIEISQESDEDVPDMHESDSEMSQPHRRLSPPKSAGVRQVPKARAAPKPATKKAVVRTKPSSRAPLSEEDDIGVRRSGRTKVKPLDFWRNERVVYGRRKSGPNVVSVVKEVVTIPVEHRALSKRSNKKKNVKRVIVAEESEEDEYNDEPIDEIPIVDWYTQEVVNQVVGLTKDMIVTKPVKNQTFEFEKTFGEQDFMSSGIIKLQCNGMKPKRNSGDSAMVFFVISGACRVTVHTTRFVISAGGQFHVPRGNQYQLENVSSKETRLFFTQARETVAAV
ncbi:hypothetical protein K493DRAFT_311389 [Basidiobolus meristosporus CBS 931.73]|uniref:CENP-C homolog n=1 Tax=Basidiobolus meristosporus CBS 931.73 TaxID=1314790 RepID=A0A1Y1Z2A3_9FUNG|nr:hypothetical protein K493DRAFT_311389 [Basidiobolus meristosporus CBS 931.73]|eukprot:ORY04431.1 hypothetical protein K493DRAFT_311389 [Basidiobolus meristosporus CBS 931.73]